MPGGCWSGIRKAAQQFLPAGVLPARVWPGTRLSHAQRQRRKSLLLQKLRITPSPIRAGAEHLSCPGPEKKLSRPPRSAASRPCSLTARKQKPSRPREAAAAPSDTPATPTSWFGWLKGLGFVCSPSPRRAGVVDHPSGRLRTWPQYSHAGGRRWVTFLGPHQPHFVYNSVTLPAPDLHLQQIQGVGEQSLRVLVVQVPQASCLSILCSPGLEGP